MKIWQTLVILLTLKFASTQPAFEDSLRNALSLTDKDSARIVLWSELAHYFSFNRLDSSIYYAQKIISYSQDNGNKYGEALGFLQLANALGRVGNYPKSLEMVLIGMNLAAELKDNKAYLLRKAFVQLGLLDRLTNQYKSGLVHLFEAVRLSEEAGKSGEDYFQIYGNLGFCYGGLGQVDSAVIYTQKGNELAIQLNDEKSQIVVLYALGRIQVLANRLDLAEQYIKQGIELSNRYNRLFFLVGFYNQLAELYKRSGKLDSCLLLAKKAFDLSQQYQYGIFFRTASRILTETYEVLHQPDSTLKYMKLMLAANDSIFGQERVRQFQLLGFDEEQRKQQAKAVELNYQNKMRLYILLSILGLFLVLAVFLFQKNKQKEKVNALLQNQKDEIAEKNNSLEQTLAQLKTTQAQLILAEKMAPLGELTAGIAHEIQNPLNFVNNFSEINKELLDEIQEDRRKKLEDSPPGGPGRTWDEHAESEKISIVKENQEKILQHGRRADAIVKGMVQHSQKSTGLKEATNINALAEEYLRLAYFSYRAQNQDFLAELKTNLDPAIPLVEVVPQDIGRVLLNLFNNAFWAVNERLKGEGLKGEGETKDLSLYSPTVTLSTKNLADTIKIRIRDNGPGISQNIIHKIFQPFFTTKPAGQGTGLGLSLSYDIIKANGGEIKVNSYHQLPGELKVESSEDGYAEFIIILPK